MPNGYVFPYGIALREGGVIETFPAAEITFFSRERERLSLFLLIDSGAALSALPVTDAPFLGIEVEKGIPMRIAGIDGKAIHGWRHELSVGIGKEMVELPVVFLENRDAPRVLGRKGVFERFFVIFEESKSRTGLIKGGTRESRKIRELLDRIGNS